MWEYTSPARSHELKHYGVPGMKWGVRRKERREHLKGAARNKRDIEYLKDLLKHQPQWERLRMPPHLLEKKKKERARENTELQKKLRNYESLQKEKYATLSEKDLLKGERYLNREFEKSIPRAQRRYERAAKRYYKRNRKYQNEDGTLTPAGRKKYGRSNEAGGS